MPVRALAVFIALTALAGSAQAGGGRRGEGCTSAVESRLRQAGLTMNDLERTRWRVDSTRSSDETNVWGYWFYARPKSCAQGDIVIRLSTTCGIQNASARGGCSLPGFD